MASIRKLAFWLVMISFFLPQMAQAVTYQTLGGGLWENSSLWSPSQPPEIIGPNDSVIVDHVMFITSSITMTLMGYLEVSGEMRDINGSTSTLLVRGDAVVQPSGILGLQTLTVTNSGLFENNGFVILINGIVNAGTINNNGNMVVLTTANCLQNTGDFNNCGTFLGHGSASFTNGAVTNCSSGFMAILRNLYIGTSGEWVNNGLVDIGGNFLMDGDGYGTGQLYVCGNFQLSSGAIWSSLETVCVDGNINDPNGYTVTSCPYAASTVCPLPLPIELLSFEGGGNEEHVKLKWATASEVNNDYFSIERSDDAENFVSIGFVPGTNQEEGIASYEFFDEQAEVGKLYYYRLKQMDRDGSVSFSKVIEVVRAEESPREMAVFPHPINGSHFTLQISNGKRAYLTDLEGRMVHQWDLGTVEGQVLHRVELPFGITSGLYFLTVETALGRRQAQKILLN